MSDHYRTLADPAEARIKIERSEFLAVTLPVTTEDGFFAELTRLQKQYFDATHHCWAYRLFAEGRSRSSDAGEPSGSAGRPILASIEGAGLHDVGAVVVRWYGGIKLGTGGLSRAYREAAAEALRNASIVDRFVYERVTVVVPFEALSSVYRLVRPPDVVLASEEYGERNLFHFDVRTSLRAAFVGQLIERRLATLP
jgi:uncharacterized YigZ family protein